MKVTSGIAIGAVLLGLGGCGGMTQGEKDTAVGAVAGGVIGNVVTGGSAIGTLGGAALGGIIGHEVGESADRRDRRYR
jgi:osmotically inducible lipoprotein OsmB